jgi:hypothetical protein
MDCNFCHEKTTIWWGIIQALDHQWGHHAGHGISKTLQKSKLAPSKQKNDSKLLHGCDVLSSWGQALLVALGALMALLPPSRCKGGFASQLDIHGEDMIPTSTVSCCLNSPHLFRPFTLKMFVRL